MSLFTRRSPLTDGSVREMADALSGPDCPACSAAQSAQRHWFSAYENEMNADPQVRARLQDSLGMCPAHTRHLLDQRPASSWLCPQLFDDVARAGLRRLAARSGAPPSPCAACQSVALSVHGHLSVLARALQEHDELAEVYRGGGGLCLEHAKQLLPLLTPAAGEIVLDRLEQALTGPAGPALATLTGQDRDGADRARLIAAAGEVLDQQAKALDGSLASYVHLVLTSPCCPLCAASARASWRFLDWLAGADQPPEELRHEAMLCRTHLVDLTTRAASARLDALVGYNAARQAGAVHETAAAARETPAGRLAGIGGSRWRQRVAALARPTDCHACAVAQAAAERELRLLATVAADPARREELANSHGLCLRHGDEATLAAAGQPWRELLGGRLALLEHDLSEARRKAAWPARWEHRGQEMSAWSGAAALLDGRVLGPALAGPRPRGSW